MDFVWKAVNVAVLVAIIYKFAKKPVGAALNRSAESAKQTVDCLLYTSDAADE